MLVCDSLTKQKDPDSAKDGTMHTCSWLLKEIASEIARVPEGAVSSASSLRYRSSHIHCTRSVNSVGWGDRQFTMHHCKLSLARTAQHHSAGTQRLSQPSLMAL